MKKQVHPVKSLIQSRPLGDLCAPPLLSKAPKSTEWLTNCQTAHQRKAPKTDFPVVADFPVFQPPRHKRSPCGGQARGGALEIVGQESISNNQDLQHPGISSSVMN